jgi:hypothetical protein
VKRIGRGESIGGVTHICMGTTQGNSLCSSLYLKLARCHVSYFIFYVFSSTKSYKRTGQVLWEEGGWHSGRREVAGKGVGG